MVSGILQGEQRGRFGDIRLELEFIEWSIESEDWWEGGSEQAPNLVFYAKTMQLRTDAQKWHISADLSQIVIQHRNRLFGPPSSCWPFCLSTLIPYVHIRFVTLYALPIEVYASEAWWLHLFSSSPLAECSRCQPVCATKKLACFKSDILLSFKIFLSP